MDIFLINFQNLEKVINSKIQKSKFHHRVSRILLSSILSDIYKINSDILEENRKPYIKDNPIYFSISHSMNVIGIAVSHAIIGLDIEYKKKRNYKAILKYMGYNNIENITENDFFKIWTKYEAEYKSGLKNSNIKYFSYKNYICSLSSTQSNLPTIYEIMIPINKINESELTNLKFVKDNAKNENEVVIHEIKMASSEFLSPPDLNIE